MGDLHKKGEGLVAIVWLESKQAHVQVVTSQCQRVWLSIQSSRPTVPRNTKGLCFVWSHLESTLIRVNKPEAWEALSHRPTFLEAAPKGTMSSK